MDYEEFLKSKYVRAADVGFDVPDADLNQQLFDWQRVVVRWALRKGRAALLEECGLGKSFQELEWSREVCKHTGESVLILTPLAVTEQMRLEGEKFGIDCRVVRHQSEVKHGISIANYDVIHNLDASRFVGVVLDESSCIKNMAGKVRNQLIRMFADTPYRLCATATPSPNDHMELGSHAEFLGVMPMNEMLMRWFQHDSGDTSQWVLKGHGEDDYWRWVCSWAVAIDKPSDIGYSDDGYILPPLNVIYHPVAVDETANAEGTLFRMDEISATSLHRELKLTTDDRADKAAELYCSIDGPAIFWCNSNYEADALMKRIVGAVEVRGDMKPELKEKRLLGFAAGEFESLVTKPSIAGFGLNYQHCSNQVFVGLSYSYEQMYQALRRSYRFGQTKPVNAHVIYAVTEGNIRDAIEAKAVRHAEMKRAMVGAMRETQIEEFKEGRLLRMNYEHRVERGESWEMHCGDSIELLKTFPAESVGMSVFSPAFSNLYVYSDSVRDMGNCANDDEFFQGFEFLIPELWRVTQHGRIAAVHCSDLPTFQWKGEPIGLKDFPGRIIALFQKHGWIYHSRVTIWKCPVTEMTRTKALGLLYKQFCKDSSRVRVGMPDYLLVFRRGEGDASEFVAKDKAEYPVETWQQWASPVWMDIDQGDVLNAAIARTEKDSRHVCALQLGLIERAIHLWSNPGDTILSPFGGIGSEGIGAMRAGRRFIGVELKEEYWRTACKFLAEEEKALTSQMKLAI